VLDFEIWAATIINQIHFSTDIRFIRSDLSVESRKNILHFFGFDEKKTKMIPDPFQFSLEH